MESFWHTSNCALSPTERDEFNAWRSEMYLLDEKLQDAVHALRDEANFLELAKKCSALSAKIRAIPVFEK